MRIRLNTSMLGPLSGGRKVTNQGEKVLCRGAIRYLASEHRKSPYLTGGAHRWRGGRRDGNPVG